MADETRGDDDGSQDQAAAGDGGDREGEDSVDEVVPPPRRGKQSLPSQGLVLTITQPQVRNQRNEEEANEDNAGEDNSHCKEGTGMYIYLFPQHYLILVVGHSGKGKGKGRVQSIEGAGASPEPVSHMAKMDSMLLSLPHGAKYGRPGMTRLPGE